MTTDTLETSHGIIFLELNDEAAPVTVSNFLRDVEVDGYNGTLFHNIIPGFTIKGGVFEPGMNKKLRPLEFKNESRNGLKNKRGTIAMDRASHPGLSTSQFLINLADNDFLNYRAPTPEAPEREGYAVFGKVVGGMDVVDKIASVRTANKGAYPNVPIEDVLIVAARIT